MAAAASLAREEPVERLKAKLRGVIGLGLVGGLVGFLGGGIWGVVSGVAGSGLHWGADYVRFLLGMAAGNAIGFMKIGGFTAAGFGVLLASIERRRSLEELSLWRMGLLGGVVGAGFPPIYVMTTMGPAAYIEAAASFLPAMGALGVVGGALAVSLVAVAKRASGAELPPSGDGQESLPPSP